MISITKNNKVIYITDERRKRDFAKHYEDYIINDIISVSTIWNFLDYLKENLGEIYKEVYPIINECYNLSLLLTRECDDFEEDVLSELGGYYLIIKNLIKIRDIVFQLDYDNFAILLNMNFVPSEFTAIWNYYYYIERKNREKTFDERFLEYLLDDNVLNISDEFLVEIALNKNGLLSIYNDEKKEKLKEKLIKKGKTFIEKCKDLIYF